MGDSIVVVQTAFLGDVVLTTPLFRALRRCHSTARIAALVTPEAAPLIEEDPHLDHVLTYDKKGGESLRSAVATVRAQRPDLLVSPHRSQRSALLAIASGARTRVGFADARFRWVYNRRVPRSLEQHEVDRNLALLGGLDCAPDASDRWLHVGYTEREAQAVAAVLREAGVAESDRVLGLCPGSVWATKRWLPRGFAAVGQHFAARGWRVAVLGSPGDREVSRQVTEAIGPAAVDAAGATPLKALAAWMDRLALLVSNDSAPLHVATARDTPTVAVFGATTTGLGFGPFHARSRVVEVDLPCRPCGLHGGKTCPLSHFRCMGDLSPEAVLAACDDLLESVP
ncbi:MAG: glycosyltransferase family 9 protein [Deferrisomatales bacterium]|nr:glycosyltransferase family 9 protein [Deferrisomatales bacterium]